MSVTMWLSSGRSTSSKWPSRVSIEARPWLVATQNAVSDLGMNWKMRAGAFERRAFSGNVRRRASVNSVNTGGRLGDILTSLESSVAIQALPAVSCAMPRMLMTRRSRSRSPPRL